MVNFNERNDSLLTEVVGDDRNDEKRKVISHKNFMFQKFFDNREVVTHLNSYHQSIHTITKIQQH